MTIEQYLNIIDKRYKLGNTTNFTNVLKYNITIF
jgi:hypothetical protein